MGFFDWLRGLFGPRRDVSRLEGDDVDLVSEQVDTSGRPMKEGHRRRALRDRRLLPKRRVPGFKRKRLMSQAEAARLFSATMRTSNRSIRDLLPDEEQLARYNLPVLKSEQDLAVSLGLTVKQLQHYTIHRHKDRVSHYVTYSIPKKSGGQRLIMAPKRRLKALQRRLVRTLIDPLPVSPSAHAFTRGRSVRTGAGPHVGKAVLLQMDLENFFPTVTFHRVRGLWLALGYGYPVATALAMLMTECERQPVVVDDERYFVPVGTRHCVQGAPTSPGVCNLVALRLDRRLGGLARRFGFEYTRYADDLTFSGEDFESLPRLKFMAERIIRDEGFRVNHAKTRIRRRGSRQVVTGVVVNQVAGLSRQERRRLRARIHQLPEQPDPGEVAVLRGKLAYLAMLNPDQARPLKAQLEQRLSGS